MNTSPPSHNQYNIYRNIPNIEYNPLQYIFEKIKLKHKPNTLWIEFGVASGTTINYISKFTKAKVYGFDSFEGLPENWREGFKKGTFDQKGINPRTSTNVILIKGWFEDTLPRFIKEHNQKISFIHIDCDLYSSTKCVLDTVKNCLSRPCIIVFDELLNYSGFDGKTGELRAFYEFVKENNVEYEWIGMNGVPKGLMAKEHQSVAVIIHKIKFNNTLYLKNDTTKMIKKLFPHLQNLDYSLKQDKREIRRNPHNWDKYISPHEFPKFTNKRKLNFKYNNIMFIGPNPGKSIISKINDRYAMGNLLIPLYFSFILEKEVYLFTPKNKYGPDILYKCDYINGIEFINLNNIKNLIEIDLIIHYKNFNIYSPSKFINIKKSFKINIHAGGYSSFTTIKKWNILNHVYPLNYLIKIPSYFLCNNLITHAKKYNKKNIILKFGAFYDYKGQLELVRDIDENIIKNYIILFIGNIYDKSYYKKVISILQSKKIQYLHIKNLNPEYFKYVIPYCKFQISYNISKHDAGPRTITESLYANVPFIATSMCHIPDYFYKNKLGLLCNGTKKDLNNNIKYILSNKFNRNILKFVEENLKMSNIGFEIMKDINNLK